MNMGFIHANGTFFMRMLTEELLSEQYFEMTNRNSTHGKNIAHGSGPDKIKSTIFQYDCAISDTNAME